MVYASYGFHHLVHKQRVLFKGAGDLQEMFIVEDSDTISMPYQLVFKCEKGVWNMTNLDDEDVPPIRSTKEDCDFPPGSDGWKKNDFGGSLPVLPYLDIVNMIRKNGTMDGIPDIKPLK